MLDGRPQTYVAFANEYYEKSISLESVESFYSLTPLTGPMVFDLNPALDWDTAVKSAVEIGYPMSLKTKD